MEGIYLAIIIVFAQNIKNKGLVPWLKILWFNCYWDKTMQEV